MKFRNNQNYEIYEDGKVWSYLTNKWIKPRLHKSGYYYINIREGGKTQSFRLNRLVYEAFNGEIPDGMYVNHIDEDKTNNHISNLNLMTPKENSNWGTAPSKHYQAVGQYDNCGRLVNVFKSIKEASKQLGIRKTRISDCCRGIVLKVKEHHFKYLNIF